MCDLENLGPTGIFSSSESDCGPLRRLAFWYLVVDGSSTYVLCGFILHPQITKKHAVKLTVTGADRSESDSEPRHPG